MILSFLKFWIRARKPFTEKILDDPFITKLLFYPRKERFVSNNAEHIWFEMQDGIKLSAFNLKKDPSKPTILLFHGNGEIINDYLYYADIYTPDGFNLVVVDFRGYGESEGKPYFTSLFNDPIEVYNQLRERLVKQGANSDIIVFGRSLGSICASVLGGKNPEGLKAMVFESGFASLYQLWGAMGRVPGIKIKEEQLRPWSNDYFMEKIEVPTLIIHGTDDEVIPFSQGELIHKAIANSLFHPIRGAGHNNIFGYRREYKDTLTNFLSQL